MAVWPVPRTWATSELVTAAMMNTLRDALNWLGAGDGIILAPPGSPARYQRWVYDVSGTFAGVHWEFLYRDDLDATDPWHFKGGSPVVLSSQVSGATSVTFTTPRTGSWKCVWGGRSSVSTGGGNFVNFIVNGTTIDSGASGGQNGGGGAGCYQTGHLNGGTTIVVSAGGTSCTSASATLSVVPAKIQ